MESSRPVDVAVGIIVNDHHFLMAKRQGHQHCADAWEFPGGKLEAAEQPLAALARELKEELGIEILNARPWISVAHTYPEKAVRLHCFLVSGYKGEPYGREGQTLAWIPLTQLQSLPVPQANIAIVEALIHHT